MHSKGHLSYILHDHNSPSDADACIGAASWPPPRPIDASPASTTHSADVSMDQLDLGSPQSPTRPQKSSTVKLMYNRVRQRGVRQREKIERQRLRQQVESLQAQLRHLQAKRRESSVEGRRMRFYGLQRWQSPAATASLDATTPISHDGPPDHP